MYRTKQEEVKNIAQQYEEQVKQNNEKEFERLKQKAQNLPKMVRQALSKIKKAAKHGEYYISYRYNPWYKFWVDFPNNHWNEYARILLEIKLKEMGFRCKYDYGYELNIY